MVKEIDPNFENNARVLHETNRGVDPAVLEDLGHKMVQLTTESTPETSQTTTIPDATPTDARGKMNQDNGQNGLPKKPFPYGTQGIDEYQL